MKIKAVIFDMDGVLIDARDWHYESLNKALGLFGTEITRYDHLVTFDGLPTKKKLEMLSLEGGLPTKLHDFINDLKQEYTWEIVYTTCKPIFHHRYALSKLKNDGYLLSVCSNSVRKTIELMMERSGLIEYLDFFLSNQDVEKGKPDPEIYSKAINRLGFQPDECLIIEDNQNGIKAALASGAHLLKVENPDDVTYQNIIKRIKEIENA
ncbi:HAD family hydrolase [Flavobacterium johnsoniae]|jgi:HAD superfamily hydrolase (TIGR01509 family)|uniref:HAD-superfamily hydrolase, subfamily IA, variant 3 n=1 Tax=Flavobacterium johnsoniae (strain ATCC 17061 / DSM 2064 / JCM 8514 / BCRC 14874 / CCUG 350202 / NBRC 14942 / NCIMB 11054 / UW101) TaxID=376686 RepID=A5FN28_FLAJ1|nr:HAD family phosphatase [Flavobacterium johnsoniae]ABQ03386.1 HAD-superfamily hydrolase, subfamily IA, variant 3 [Flavobacterium johnsoniae UW101]OXG01199.1 HAD family hydrolase [Flavobacterium johnsoniae UW101]WQG79749.1 HAD family phosphatase [Flavobacterium johnsoniae UW101]SHL76746.1 haloacid dehalogenase superfamily, subfamily IA, variant 3 with third motif having DD or ED [Flavobacterium johnsoniae]